MFKREENVPLSKKSASNIKYPFEDMKIGESWFIDDELSFSRIKQAATKFKFRNKDFNHTIRKVEGGYRLWRIPIKEVS